MKHILTISLAGALFGLSGVATLAADDFSPTERVERGWYVNTTAGVEGFAVVFDDQAIDDIAANAYYGVGGTVELCSAGTGSTEWLDLCGGLHGFASLGSASQELSATLGGGSSETDFYSYGAYGKARMNWGAFALAPYAGLRQIESTTTITQGGTTEQRNDLTAIFGGIESDISFMNGRGSIGTRIEYGGTTDGDTQLHYVSGNLFVGVRF